MACGERVEVEEKFVSGVIRIVLSKVDRVLLAFLGAREIEVAPETIGNGKVGLLNAAEHLLVKLFLEGVCAAKVGVGPSIFGVQVGDHFGILLVVEPGVRIDAAIFVNDVLDRVATRDGRAGRIGCWRGGVGFGSHGPLARSGIGWPVQNNLAAGFCLYYIEKILGKNGRLRGRRRS